MKAKVSGFALSSVERVMSWARSRSLWYISTGSGCCADEVLNAAGCRYDIERFGCLPQVDPRQADLLIVNGIVSYKAAPHLLALYDQMLSPKYVMAIGACACSGGAFGPESSYAAMAGVDRLIPVDVYVPGCPPRPEAIMDGLINLQRKIHGNGSAALQT